MSKVSPITAKRLDGICRRYRFRSKYEILQYLVSAFLRYIDSEEDGCVTDELAQLFEAVKSDTRFGAVKSDHTYQADHIIVTLGTSCIVGDVKDGHIVRTSVQAARAYDIVTRLTPQIHSRLQGLRQDMDLANVMEAVKYAVSHAEDPDTIGDEIDEEFGMLAEADRSAYHVGGPKPKRAPNVRTIQS